ncbi:histidinol dehydrogenase [uncultured Thermanaerothrix sp.]|uniref:histidinol dehydrogenase n=1 Tax=uncultured Thermanaerothrix sp. TaxID=1195149 RepID=UPI0026139B85|nr:histidinol dehydrogenase [uncultured Thermanaerothrix sp.]
MNLRIYDPNSACRTLLHRQPPDMQTVPPVVKERIQALFGEPLTPAQAVARILAEVRDDGDAALRQWSQRLDGWSAETFRLPPEALQAALERLPASLRHALQEAANRIEAFHRRQPLTSWITQDLGGTLGQLVRPIRRVGIYVPGGSAPLPSTVLMSAIPARVAGVREIALVTPPQREGGYPADVILAAAAIAGVNEVYVLGGAQAIAALAYGTESIPRVDKIVGPGNLFVTLAKQQVYGVVGIDGLAGPTETVIIADETARPDWVAADLLAQAEHDVLAAAILLTPSAILAHQVQETVARQAETLPRREVLALSLVERSGIVLTRDLEEAIALSNAYAPEHLNLVVADPWRWIEKIESAGGIFVGEHSYEVLGDYAAGPSHVMPTGGSARFASPLNVWDFVRLVSLVALDPQTARQVGRLSASLARAEGLEAHARAADIRAEVAVD